MTPLQAKPAADIIPKSHQGSDLKRILESCPGSRSSVAHDQYGPINGAALVSAVPPADRLTVGRPQKKCRNTAYATLANLKITAIAGIFITHGVIYQQC